MVDDEAGSGLVRKRFHAVLGRLEAAGLLPQFHALPDLGPIDWSAMPAPADPCRQRPAMPAERARRKRLQIEGMWRGLA